MDDPTLPQTSIHRWPLGSGSSLHPPCVCSFINNIAFPGKSTGSRKNMYMKDNFRLCTTDEIREMRTMGGEKISRQEKGLPHRQPAPTGSQATTGPLSSWEALCVDPEEAPQYPLLPCLWPHQQLRASLPSRPLTLLVCSLCTVQRHPVCETLDKQA